MNGVHFIKQYVELYKTPTEKRHENLFYFAIKKYLIQAHYQNSNYNLKVFSFYTLLAFY